MVKFRFQDLKIWQLAIQEVETSDALNASHKKLEVSDDQP
jgi:hypothetical protein